MKIHFCKNFAKPMMGHLGSPCLCHALGHHVYVIVFFSASKNYKYYCEMKRNAF